MNVEISVIIPLYKGKKYLESLIAMLEVNQEYLDKHMLNKRMEVILINDAPAEIIEDTDISSEIVPIRLLVNEENMGIHKSRIKGLEKARGQFILFLDQDDVIAKEYFYEQLQLIGDADAVLCNGVHRENKLIYKDLEQQREAVSRQGYYTQKTVIISPGQVLLRRRAIPDEWKCICLAENGSDDVLLWILMLRNNSRFVLNPSCLYRHVEEGDNTSLNFQSMKSSVEELMKVITNNRLLDGEELNVLVQALKHRIDKYEKYISVLENWGTILGNIVKLKKEKKYEKFAVYGYGVIGRKLRNDLAEAGVKINFFIDRVSGCYRDAPCEIYPPDKVPWKADVIIITPLFDIDNIKAEMEKLGSSVVLGLMEFG